MNARVAATASLAPPTADQWRRIFALLDTALELEPAARADWLAMLDPEHAPLAPWLDELLRTHALRDTADFLGRAGSFGLTAPAGAASIVGPYRLLREIGQGGMATVWLAERADGLLERKVAVKLPHVSWGAASFADRMARERNILASLTHPNIARLYDAGLGVDGRPYLALEYVDGLPIDAYAAAHELGVRTRIELIVQVARAVAHAHARLIVHRDLKPSNILVDAGGIAHLLDFGIARLVDPDISDAAVQLTQAPGRALTPDYASPEQIRGEAIGTASDVYSLGVVAFELLAGDRPHRFAKGLSAAALATAIDSADPPRASARTGDEARARQLKGDLDAILVRALARASGERYATVDAFADDLERHLRGEPVLARPDSAWYRAERWVRRHKLESAVAVAIVVAVPAGAAAQAAVLAAIAAGAGIALWQARVARRQAQRATEEAARAAAVKAFLTSFFKSGSLEEDGGLQLGRLSVQQFVERGAQKIDAGFANEPDLKSELFDVVSTLFADLSDGAATIQYARKWQQALQQTGAGVAERARASQRWAQGLALAERNIEAVEVLESAVASLRRQKTAARASVLALLLVDLARLRALLGDKQRAAVDADAALALLATPDGSDRGAAGARAAAVFQRADLMALDNQLVAAAPLFEEAIARMELVHGARSTIVGRHRYIFAGALAEGRRVSEAERQYRAARALFRDAGGDADLNAAIVELELGRLLAIAGAARAEGLELLGHARDVFTRRVDAVSPIYPATAALYLAEARVEDGDLEGAREPIEAAAAMFRDKVENSLMRTLAQVLHARFLSECGAYDASNAVLEETRDEYLRLVGAQHPHTASVINRIGANHLRAEAFERARSLFDSVVGAQDQVEEVWGSIKHLAQHNRALVSLEEGDIAAALPSLQRFWDAYCAAPAEGRNAMTEAGLSLSLGRALLARGQAQTALPHLQRSVDALITPYPRGPGLAMGRSWLGLACLALGDEAQARGLAALAGAIFEAQPSCGIHYRRGYLLLIERLAARDAEG